MQSYIENGSFLTPMLYAILTNDLYKTMHRMDTLDANLIHIILYWFDIYAPTGCMGSHKMVDEWIKGKYKTAKVTPRAIFLIEGEEGKGDNEWDDDDKKEHYE